MHTLFHLLVGSPGAIKFGIFVGLSGFFYQHRAPLAILMAAALAVFWHHLATPGTIFDDIFWNFPDIVLWVIYLLIGAGCTLHFWQTYVYYIGITYNSQAGPAARDMIPLAEHNERTATWFEIKGGKRCFTIEGRAALDDYLAALLRVETYPVQLRHYKMTLLLLTLCWVFVLSDLLVEMVFRRQSIVPLLHRHFDRPYVQRTKELPIVFRNIQTGPRPRETPNGKTSSEPSNAEQLSTHPGANLPSPDGQPETVSRGNPDRSG